MSYTVDDDPPIKTGPASRAYRDNYDRIFGPPCEACSGTGCVVDPNIDLNTVETEGDLLVDCPCCTGPCDCSDADCPECCDTY